MQEEALTKSSWHRSSSTFEPKRTANFVHTTNIGRDNTHLNAQAQQQMFCKRCERNNLSTEPCFWSTQSSTILNTKANSNTNLNPETKNSDNYLNYTNKHEPDTAGSLNVNDFYWEQDHSKVADNPLKN
jgi:hypothetical protein